MRKNVGKLSLHRESLRNLSAPEVGPARGAQPTRPSIDFGCTTEYTWMCPSYSACTYCPPYCRPE